MLKCAGCGTVAYCGTRCQKRAWRRGHREECKRIQRERAEEEEEEEKKRKKEAEAIAAESRASGDAAVAMTAEEIISMEAEVL